MREILIPLASLYDELQTRKTAFTGAPQSTNDVDRYVIHMDILGDELIVKGFGFNTKITYQYGMWRLPPGIRQFLFNDAVPKLLINGKEILLQADFNMRDGLIKVMVPDTTAVPLPFSFKLSIMSEEEAKAIAGKAYNSKGTRDERVHVCEALSMVLDNTIIFNNLPTPTANIRHRVFGNVLTGLNNEAACVTIIPSTCEAIENSQDYFVTIHGDAKAYHSKKHFKVKDGLAQFSGYCNLIAGPPKCCNAQ